VSFAIIGMACIYPGAPDAGRFWANIEAGRDAITEVPPSRWEPLFYDPSSSAVDRFYCKRGGFVDAYAAFDALGFGVMPVAVRGAEPDQLLCLQVASHALGDAGYADRPFPRERTGVVLGRGSYQTAGMTRLEQRVRTAEQLAACLRTLVPGLSDAELAEVKHEFQAQLGAYGPDTAIGLVPNLAASRIANRLDLHGPAYTVDAACASSLLAVDHACRDLQSGRTDLALAGGVHLTHDVTFWSVFCQLGALSRSQQIRPFDRRADGLLMGEGVGIVVLKRLADAERDGDRIYAVIRGTGVASDGREASLMTPRVEGQVLALEEAWRMAGLDPASVGLVEAHGTGTPAGDAAELATLARVFGAPQAERAALGSVKSMIGHAMPAAGAAGLIKAALAVHHGVLPPTLHCEEPHERLSSTRFRVLSQAEPWEHHRPRRAGVNAFGFGGINAHVVLEEHAAPARRGRRKPASSGDAPEELLVLAAENPQALIAALDAGRTGGSGPCRLALVNPKTEERRAQARAAIARGERRHGRDGLGFTPHGFAQDGGKVAFLFPGVEATFVPRLEDVARHFQAPAPEAADPSDLESVGHAIVAAGRLLSRALEALGVRAQAVAGHSIGEWSGMIMSGMIPAAEVDSFLGSLVPGSLEVPGVSFAAVGCGAEAAEAALEGLSGITVSHDNCPHQSILCGHEASIDDALGRLRSRGVLAQKLPFRSGFHSPLFADYLALHREHLRRLPVKAPEVPLWSATTAAPYPTTPEEIRALALEHLVRPVRFRELTLRLYEDGVRIFVQVGTGSLIGFIEDTLRGRPHLAMSANVPQRSGMAQLRRLAAALFVEGVPVEFAALPEPRAKREGAMKLDLGVPLVKMRTPLALSPVLRAPEASDPVVAEFNATMRRVAEAQEEVMRAWRGAGPRESTDCRTLSVEAEPFLVDHCFFRQPPGWTSLPDRYPVVPLTTSLAWVMDAARALVPTEVVVAIEGVRAYRWLAVAPPVEITVRARFDGRDAVAVSIEGYLDATVRMGARYPAAPAPDTQRLADETPAPLGAERLYIDRWMFHGPAFQGVVDLGPRGRDGIRGVLRALPAPGGLLDNAGQLLGFWVMIENDIDRLAMPVKIERLAFFGPEPPPGTPVECTVRIRECGAREVRADIELSSGGRVWGQVQGWEDRRFESDARLWQVLREPEHHLLAEPRPGGYVFFFDRYKAAQSRDFLARRYLGERERAEYEAVGLPRQRQWLAGRIAAKDAVRDLLWRKGRGPTFPVEVEVASEPSGEPRVRAPAGERLRVSIAHKDDLAVAIAGAGAAVGIDLERIAPRSEGFEEIAFTDAERARLPAASRDEWVTRLWSAKEAVAKARGTGLSGNPRRFEASEIAEERFCVDGTWVETRREGEYVVAWTGPANAEKV
jgi:acyl transferase domain-containing protein/phosphopantetheinyl transferase